MKCFIFSIGEKTTDLCCELMESYGYEVILLKDPDTSLWEKLKEFYDQALATNEQEFIRIDADIIPNRNVLRLENNGWQCASGFDWYAQDRKAISVHLMDRSIIELCRKYINEAYGMVRPETYLWRKLEINPYTSIRWNFSCGLHGYGQTDQRERIKKLKGSRNQEYDWSLIEKIEALNG